MDRIPHYTDLQAAGGRQGAVTRGILAPGIAAQLVNALRICPMPQPVKEEILDQVLGYHDDLHRPARKRQTRTPMRQRVAEARTVGAFKFLRTERDGTDVYRYHKNGVPAYLLTARDGCPLSCECRNFQLEHWGNPAYRCKHMDLWLEMENAVTQAEYEALVDAAAQAAADCARVRIAFRHGLATREEYRAAGQRERDAAQGALSARPDVTDLFGEEWAASEREERAA